MSGFLWRMAGALVLAPWVGRNLATFDKPVYLSTGLDVTMAVTNCDETYDGYFKAFWYMPCILREPPPKGDLSVQAEFYRHQALDYMKSHKGRLPEIFALRVGRTDKPGDETDLPQIDFASFGSLLVD